jgi:hypothetical protein
MNEHATEIIDAYLEAKGFAVPHALLITGRWGSGKTYFLDKIYTPHRRARLMARRGVDIPFLFVSLFGATSASDLEMRMYKTANPAEAVAGSVTGALALGIGEFFRVKETTKGVVDKLGKKAIKRLNEYVFVFDDLERVEPSAFGEVMGLINSLVTEHGRKVLLVTDEQRLTELIPDAVWKDQNEKIVGRRAHIEPDLPGVLDVSISDMPEGTAKALIAEYRDEFLDLARISDVENLRNLSWAMHNVAAFARCLLGDGDIPVKHTMLTLKVVLATTLWLREGLVDSESLGRLPGLSMAMAVRSISRERNAEPLEKKSEDAKRFSDRFLSLKLDAPPIDYGFITAFEQSGVLDAQGTVGWIKTQFGFGPTHEEPSWRRLWYSHERPIDDTERAIDDLKSELERHVHVGIGPIMHAAGLAIRQMSVGDRRLTGGEDVVAFFEKYIDHVADSGLLEQSDFDYMTSRDDSHGGLGYSSQETDEFQTIYRHLRSRSKALADAGLKADAEAALERAVAGDLEALFDLVRRDSKLSRDPVLMEVSVERLADLMARDMPFLNAGSKMLAYRYHEARDGHPLLQEIQWARKVHAAVLEKIAQWPEPHGTMGRNLMNGLLAHYERGKRPEDMILPPPAEEAAGAREE